MKSSFLATILATLLLTIGVMCDTHQHLQFVSAEDFESDILKSSHVWLVQFSSDDNLHKELDKAAEAVAGVFKVASVDVNKAINAGITIPDLGGIYFYGDDKENPIAYTGSHAFKDYVKFILGNVKELVDARSKSAK